MAFNGGGVFNRLYSWVQDAINGIKIRADRMDAEMNGFATGLTDCVTRDGQSPALAALPMGGFNHTNCADGTEIDQYATVGQLQDSSTQWADDTGVADALEATYVPAIVVLQDGMLFGVRALFANATTTPTFSPNGQPPEVITKFGGEPLDAGDIAGPGAELLLRYDLPNTRYELLNPRGLPPLWGVAAGTAQAITVTIADITALTDGLLIGVRALLMNTATVPTLQINALAAETITKLGGQALVGGDIAGPLHELILRYNLANTRFELLNPVWTSAQAVVQTWGNVVISAPTQLAAIGPLAANLGWKITATATENGGGAGDDTLEIGTASGVISGTRGVDNIQFAINASTGRGAGSITKIVRPTAPTMYYVNGVSTVSGPSSFGNVIVEQVP